MVPFMVRTMTVSDKCRLPTDLFVAVRLQEAILVGQSTLETMVVRLVQALTVRLVDERQKIHLNTMHKHINC